MKKHFAVILVLFFLSLPVFAEIPAPKFWAYAQSQFELTKTTDSFSLINGRGFVAGNLSDKISYLVEVQSVPAPTLLKAQISWTFAKDTKVIFGQQSNSFKFFNPDPSARNVVVYPLTSLVPSTEDIGVTLEGKLPTTEYRLSFVNGAGTNRKDDNTDKDLITWVKLSPMDGVALIGCWQGGYQGIGASRYYRSGQWLQGEIKFSSIFIRPTWVKRNDLNQQGWFIQSFFQLKAGHQFMVQYLYDYNKDKEVTIGGIFLLSPRMRILPNAFYRWTFSGQKNFGVYLMAHWNIGKDI